jgi:arginine deiminase
MCWSARRLAAPGVITAGCPPPGVARLAGRIFDAGLADTVLAVPPGHPERRLDTVCTMLNGDTVPMRPPAAYSLTARVLTPGLDRLRVVETGSGPGRREQWDDAGNSLVLAPGLMVLHERNVATLERCGVEVIAVPGGELRGRRGGPRSLCCPVSRDPAPLPAGLCNEL